MIRLEERLPKKMPGKTSIFVGFDYNKNIIDAIKSTQSYHYDKVTHEWECPVISLSKLVNILSPIDEVSLRVIENKEEKNVVYELDNYKTKPFDYQIDSIQYGLNHDKWLLLDPPGLGKTLSMLYLAQELKKRDNITHCLVVCGINTLKANWKKEVKLHSDLSCRVLGEYVNSRGNISYGGLKERINQLSSELKEFFIITNIETLRNNEIIDLINDGPNKFDMIVLDEAHKCKSHTSQQGKNLLKLNNARFRIALTGTPIVNNPLDTYVPLKWIEKDNSTYTNFKYFYCVFGGTFNNLVMGFKNTKVLKDQISDCSLRRSKKLLKLPPKTIINEEVDMNSDQKKFYDNVSSGIVEQVNKVEMNSSSLLAMITRLRQATSCPTMLTTENISSSKIDRCCELIDEIVGNGEKVVVFSTFKETLNVLEQRLSNYKTLLCTGDVKDSVISDNIDKFQDNKDYKIMLATTFKMGTGITLTAASYAIFLDSSYTKALNEQCEDRIYRIGSKNPVFIYYLWNTDSIDMRVKQIVEDKSLISDYVLDDRCSPTMFKKLKSIISDL